MSLLDFLQSASNAVAGNVTGPVDLITLALRKAGVPVPEDAVGTSAWAKGKGLVRDVEPGAARVAGETAGILGPMLAVHYAPQIARSLLKAAENAAAPRTLNPQTGAIVWHGSPHKFDKFDSSKIGTGEGAQSYGHGLYLADSPAVAQSYKDLNPTARTSPIRAFRGTELTPGTPEYHAATLLDGMGLQQARKTVANWIAEARPEMAREAEGWRKTLETLNAATSKADFKTLKNTGNLYKVDLPDEAIAKMLDWDKPLSQQAPAVKKAVMATRKNLTPNDIENLGGAAGVRALYDPANKIDNFLGTWESLRGKQDAGEVLLREAGIPGLRYLDQGSRAAGQGTSNYVVFDDSLLTILERNGIPIR